MNLPIVDPFQTPLALWNERRPTFEESLAAVQSGTYTPHSAVRVALETTLYSQLDAALHIARVGADNRVGNHIDSFAAVDKSFQAWRKEMPSRTPAALSQYQTSYPNYDSQLVSYEISAIQRTLSDGQYVFHGGMWLGGDANTYVTDRPLSTSLCPQVAMRNAEHKGKAYYSNAIHLLALRAYRPKTNVFVYRRSGTHGHELEVLFSAGAVLTLESVQVVNTSYQVGGLCGDHKMIPVSLVQATIS